MGEYTVQNNEGQRGARKKCIEAQQELREDLEAGKTIYFLCAPRRSLHPFRAGMEQREPRLLI
jgi:hypothetical protein